MLTVEEHAVVWPGFISRHHGNGKLCKVQVKKKAILAIYFSSKPGLLHRSIQADSKEESGEVVAAG